MPVVPAEPGSFTFDVSSTALLVIDMQRDFLEPGGFGEMLGNDVSQLARTVEPLMAVLAAARATGMTVIHTPIRKDPTRWTPRRPPGRSPCPPRPTRWSWTRPARRW